MEANLAALKTLRALQAAQRLASPDEQAVLARWSGWGATPAVFDTQSERFAPARELLRELLSDEEYAAAKRSTINAHYTDAAYVQAIWRSTEGLGFKGGRVLEPGSGSGNFIAFAPESARMVGVELEPTTAALAKQLYPRADIRNESFADTRLPEGSFDLVVGNVPFGAVTLHDPRHNSGGHAIHNHFIVKSLHLTRPEGMVAVLSSRYTMDAMNPAARREMAELGDLVGAVRLPTGAHQRAAGTEVVTDVLVFRRRAPGAPAAGAAFEQSVSAGLADAPGLRINQYFEQHPEHVLGKLGWRQGELGRQELLVEADRPVGPALEEALGKIVARAREQDLVMGERSRVEPQPVAQLAAVPGRPDGYLQAHPNGTFTKQLDGEQRPLEVPRTQAAELRMLLGLRDTAVGLLEIEAKSVDDTDELARQRQRLNEQYDSYAKTYGPLNRFTWRRTGGVDAETGEEKFARIKPPQGGFRVDPFSQVVYSLEEFNPSTQLASKAPIFTQRVVSRKPARLGADDPADALAISLDTHGEARLDTVARLLGTKEEDARKLLGTLVFDEPGSNRLTPAAEYLSGNVRLKLAAAESAAAEDPRYAANVTSLKAVLPRDLGPDEIHARLGAAWIAPDYVRQFLSETLEDPSIRVERPMGNVWSVTSSQRYSVLATSRWGTNDWSAPELANALLEQRPIRVYEETPDGRRVVNPTATVAAVEKASELGARFSEWVWEEPERAKALSRTYNDQFNAIVPRSYDSANLTLPGLALSFQPRQHQVAAVARVINEPAVGLFHEVGAGKTAEMVMGAMELRRLGLAQKPVVVVPNHMLEQFSREWLQLYPQAKVLAATKEDLDQDKRKLFVARVATGDWDGVVMTRSAFERIPMSPDYQKQYIGREVAELTEALQRAGDAGTSRMTVKRLERMKLSAEERLKEKLDSAKDPGITFEQLGVDYIFADEAHGYKNLRTPSNIPGMSVDGSQRASDMHMKLEFLREKGGRVATLATATPIANSMGEAYTMQRFLRPDLLQQAGVGHFDTWAATFGETTTSVEVAPDGSGLRMQSRFAKFRNVPELLQLWKVSADIKTAEDLKLPVPLQSRRRSDGERAPETVVVPASAEMKEFVKGLAARAEKVRGQGVDPAEDNFLKITSDGRAAALDLRLVGHRTEELQKVGFAASRIATIYEANREKQFPIAGGETSPKRGALQLVFADLGTPGGARFSVYDALREELAARGVPREAVRFMHEARNDREKAELFAAAREGEVSVLIGSTERMGVGTNVQRRAVALHHLDCPWRPADLAQRDGRILRQGNANEEVQILRYITEGSFDAYSWQTVTRKAQFISQVMRGRLDVREMDDIGETALSYNEVKALATGNPLLLEQASAQAEVTKLERLQRSHGRNQETLRYTLRDTDQRIVWLGERLQQADETLSRLGGAPPAGFRVTVDGQVFDKPGPANEVLRRIVVTELAQVAFRDRSRELGDVHGFAIRMERPHDSRAVTLSLRGVPGSEVRLDEMEAGSAALGTRLANRLEALPTVRASTAADIDRLTLERARAVQEIGKPFGQTEQLEAARERLRDIDERISQKAQERPKAEEPPTDPGWRGTLPEAIAESQRTGKGEVAFVSADWEKAARVRVTSVQDLLVIVSGGGAQPPGEGRDGDKPYAVKPDGTIHNVVAGRDEYLRVAADGGEYPGALKQAVNQHFGHQVAAKMAPPLSTQFRDRAREVPGL